MTLTENTLQWLFMAILLINIVHSITLYCLVHLLVTGRSAIRRRSDAEVRNFTNTGA
jgi:hypothetical protein